MAQKLGEILVGLGLIDAGQLRHALAWQNKHRSLRIGEALVVLGALDETEILRALARQQRVPFADPSLFLRIDPRLRKLVPRSKALHYALVPIRYIDGQLIVATCIADNLRRIEELTDALGHKLRLVFAGRDDIETALGDCYKIDADTFQRKLDKSSPAKLPLRKNKASSTGKGTTVRHAKTKQQTKKPQTIRAQVAREIIDELPADTGVFRLTSEALFDFGEDELMTSEYRHDDNGDVKTDRGQPFSDPTTHEVATVYDQNLAHRLRQELMRDDEKSKKDSTPELENFAIQPLTIPPQQARKSSFKKSSSAAPAAASAPPPPRAKHSRHSSGRDKPINRIPTGIRREKSETLVRQPKKTAPSRLPAAASVPDPRKAPQRPRARLDQVPQRTVQRKAQPPLLNEKFGDYLLLRKIATGGMAEVFAAKTKAVEGISRQVAIKRILPNLTDDAEFVDMFVDEAKITVQLNHVNIGQVYELGRVDDAYFIAMEYIRGRDLNAILSDAWEHKFSIPIALATHIMQQVLAGLDYAHQKKGLDGQPLNIVHRDVSPANVLCSFEGQVKIIDFGIAKAVSKVSLTRPGLIKGKISYMSPEQMRGQKIDQRSDIFAAGIILYELLTGQRLFAAKSDVETIRNVLKGQIKPIRELRPDIPADLADVVERCLQRDRQARYACAGDASQDLQRVMIVHNYRHPHELVTQYMETRFGGLNAFEEA